MKFVINTRMGKVEIPKEIAFYTTYWEFLESVEAGRVTQSSIEKLVQVHEFVSDLKTIFYKVVKGQKGIKVKPHTIMRLAFGPIDIEDIKKILVSSLQYMIGEKVILPYKVEPVRYEREELYFPEINCFAVIGNWNTSSDIISVGVRGLRDSIACKAYMFGFSKDEFEVLSNAEKLALFKE
jgi:hypothetical protein